MKRILSLIVLMIIVFSASAGTASAELRWSKLGFDSESKIYISPGYEKDHSLFALVDKDLYLSIDEGENWNKTNATPVWILRVEQNKNIYIMQGADRNNLAIYKYNTLAQGDWEKICDAPADTANFTVLSNGTVIAVKPVYFDRDQWLLLRAESPGYFWQDTGFTEAGEFLESTPDGLVYTRENETDIISQSITYGHTWENVSSILRSNKFYVSPEYASDKMILSITNNKSVSVSYDGGKYWQERMTGIGSSSYLADLAFSPAYKSDRVIYALDREGRVFTAVNTLVDWKSHGVSADYADGREFNTLAVLPGGKLLAGAGDGVYGVINYIQPAQRAKASFVIGKSSYTIGQSDWLMDTVPFIDGDRTFVPLRYLAYALGISDDGIRWDGTKNEAAFTKNKTEVKVIVGSRTLTVNKQPVTMDVPPQIRDSRVFLPARWVAEAFGAIVSWDEQSKSVVIEYEK